jgi:hypothetical protein
VSVLSVGRERADVASERPLNEDVPVLQSNQSPVIINDKMLNQKLKETEIKCNFNENSRIGQVGGKGSHFDNGLYVKGEIDGKDVDFLLDSGSTATLISKETFNRINRNFLVKGLCQFRV